MWLQVFLPTDAIVQSEEARIEFDKEPGHDKLKVSAIPAVLSIDHLILEEETDPLLEQVFVYDYAEEENLGW
jgi:hypothetical protein